mgnify:CR=1 FL=1
MHAFDSFTYCWTDHKNKMLYVGIHKGSHNDGYICSSKTMKEEYKKRPEDFTRQILARGTYAEMCVFETTILKSVDCAKNKSFYNRHANNGKYYNRKCLPMTAEKISKSNLGKPKPKARGPRPNFRGEGNHFYGKTHSDEFKLRQSERKKKEYVGAGNPRAMTIMINNTIYYTMKEAAAALSTTNYYIRKMLESGQARRLD